MGLYSQTGKSYYVSANNLNLRNTPTTRSEIVAKLEKHDNLNLITDTLQNGWCKVNFEGTIGFVSGKHIKPGRCIIVSTESYRVGAICKDGTFSYATGRGACSHHGGVARWKVETRKTVRIVHDK